MSRLRIVFDAVADIDTVFVEEICLIRKSRARLQAVWVWLCFFVDS